VIGEEIEKEQLHNHMKHRLLKNQLWPPSSVEPSIKVHLIGDYYSADNDGSICAHTNKLVD